MPLEDRGYAHSGRLGGDASSVVLNRVQPHLKLIVFLLLAHRAHEKQGKVRYEMRGKYSTLSTSEVFRDISIFMNFGMCVKKP